VKVGQKAGVKVLSSFHRIMYLYAQLSGVSSDRCEEFNRVAYCSTYRCELDT
jgi:hypothetical protein